MNPVRKFLPPSSRRQALLLALLASPLAHAAVQPTHWYHLGESEAATTNGASLTTLRDSIGNASLDATGHPFLISLQPCPAAADRISSTRSLTLPSPGAYAQGPLLGTETDDFGFETWVYFSQTTGTHTLAANGTPGVDGWDLSLTNGVLTARLGAAGSITTDYYPSGWAHLALVRTKGVTTLYINGFSRGTSTAAVATPTGHFHLAGSPGATNLTTGWLDEARYFRIGTTAFNPQIDLLVNAPQIHLTIGSVEGIDGGTVDLGEVPVGGRFTNLLRAFDSTRYLDSRFNVSSVTFSGPDAADFKIVGNPLPGLYSGFLTFRPTSAGVKTATMTVISNDPDQGTITVTLKATAIPAPFISLFAGADPATAPVLGNNTTPVSFPATAPASSGSEQTFTVRNDGLADLHLGAISVLGTNSADFTVTHPPAVTTLAVGASTTFTVKFSPTASGARRGLVIIDSDGYYAKRFHIALAGTATGPEIRLTGPGGSPLTSHALSGWGGPYSPTNFLPSDLGQVTALAAGSHFVAALRSDGTVAVSTDDPLLLEVPAGLNNAIAISGDGDGSDFLLALRGDGTVVAWGNNNTGQCDVPAGLTGVVAISAGYDHALALKSDGSVVSWGRSYNLAAPTPPPPSAQSGVIAISAGAQHHLALKSDGTVIAWDWDGGNDYRVPLDLPPLTAIAVSSEDSYGLTRDGAVTRWNASTIGYVTVLSASPSPFVSISGQNSILCAIRADGTYEYLSIYSGYPEGQPPAGLTHVTALTPGEDLIAAVSDSPLDFGATDLAHPAAAQNVTVTNSGAAPLHLTRAEITGVQAAAFTLTGSAAPLTLNPGETTTFTVAFTPSAAGPAQATLRLTNDDPGHPDFTLGLFGSAFSVTGPLDAWRLQHFATTANSGDSADDADPNQNGIPNLLEYALGGDPVGNTTGASILPDFKVDRRTGNLYPRFNFRRIPARDDVNLTVQSADSPAGPWIDIAASSSGSAFIPLQSTTQISEVPQFDTALVLLTETLPDTPTARRFYRLQATRPE